MNIDFDTFVILFGVATFALIGGHTYWAYRKQQQKESLFDRTLRR